jgi:hypothetical protein
MSKTNTGTFDCQKSKFLSHSLTIPYFLIRGSAASRWSFASVLPENRRFRTTPKYTRPSGSFLGGQGSLLTGKISVKIHAGELQ